MEEDYTKYLKLINNCDDNDPLLSTTALGRRLSEIKLTFINSIDLSKFNQFIQSLNVEQLITTENGLARDYRGLAELMGFIPTEIKTRFVKSYNPTKSLIDAFIIRNSDSQGNCNISLNDLIKFIEKLERFDIIDDLIPILIDIVRNDQYNNHQQQMLIRNESRISNDCSIKAQNLVSDVDRLTIDDTSQFTTLYDAFICYAPDDIHYAQELISLLENYNARVAIADDLLPGHFEHDALIRLIEMRCRKVIIILTPNFSRSKECEFQTKFAGESAIRDNNPKIIPVLYEPCEDSMIPSMIKVMSKIDMTVRGSQDWQIRRLIHSLGLNMRNRLDSRSSNDNRMIENNNALQYENTQQRSRLTSFLSVTNTMDNSNSSGPIVDLLQSQDSREFVTTKDNNSLQSTCSINHNIDINNYQNNESPTKEKKPSSKLSQTFRGMVNKVFGNNHPITLNSSISPSTSSQLMLLSSSSIDCPNDSINNDSK